jgi:hypothetical protein
MAHLRQLFPPPHIRAFFRAIRKERDLSGGFLAAAMAGFMTLSATLPVSETVADIGIARFHRRLPFEVWAPLQPWPAMYNFENLVIVGLTSDAETPPARLDRPIWLNHHITFFPAWALRRQRPEISDPCVVFVLASAYRGYERTTEYVACPTAADEYQLSRSRPGAQ